MKRTVFLMFFLVFTSLFGEVHSLTPDSEGAQAFNASLFGLRSSLKENLKELRFYPKQGLKKRNTEIF